MEERTRAARCAGPRDSPVTDRADAIDLGQASIRTSRSPVTDRADFVDLGQAKQVTSDGAAGSEHGDAGVVERVADEHEFDAGAFGDALGDADQRARGHV